MPKIKAGSININYDIYGQGDPLLLIMGFGMPGAAWLPSLPMLSSWRPCGLPMAASPLGRVPRSRGRVPRACEREPR